MDVLGFNSTTEIFTQVKEAVLIVDEVPDENSSLESHLLTGDSSACLPNA